MIPGCFSNEIGGWRDFFYKKVKKTEKKQKKRL